MNSDAPPSPAGWYDHPTMADTMRYWDGEQWTDQLAPKGRPSAPPQPQPGGETTIAKGILLALVVVALIAGAVWIVYGMATANDEFECLSDNVDRSLAGEPEEDCG